MKTKSRVIRGTVAMGGNGTYFAGYSNQRNPGHMGRGHLGISSHNLSDSTKALRNFKKSIRTAHNQK